MTDKETIGIACPCLSIAMSARAQSTNELLRFLQPLAGTPGNGQTIPAVGVPCGMTQWTPQTRTTEKIHLRQ